MGVYVLGDNAHSHEPGYEGQGPQRPTGAKSAADRQWVGKRASGKWVPAPDTSIQSEKETELRNKQVKQRAWH